MRRAVVSGATCAALLGTFLAVSRWPSLERKEAMGGAGRAAFSGLGFDVPVAWSADDTAMWRVVAIFLDWAWSNRNGMAFGILFAGALIPFLSTLPAVRPRSRVLGAALGAVVGAPLGVCANCAAPVGRGMALSGERTETVLAATIASPTLNGSVLALLFALFPSFVGWTRLGLLAVLLLAIVPLVSGAPRPFQASLVQPAEESGALTWFLRHWLRATLHIAWTTVPFMALAGLLGAIVVVLVPPDALKDIDGIVAILAASAMGTFLPVPIAFDLVFASTLNQAGLPMGPTGALVLTLGTWSVYAAIVAGRSVGWRASWGVSLGVFALGVAGGVGIGRWEAQRAAEVDALAVPPLERRVSEGCSEFRESAPDCVLRVTTVLAARGGDLAPCAALGGADAVASCEIQVLTASRRARLDEQALAAACLVLAGDAGRQSCEDDARVRSGRPSACEGHSDRRRCEAAIAERDKPCAPDDVSCALAVAVRSATGRGDLARCDSMPDPDACVVAMASKLATEVSDRSLCNEVGIRGGDEAHCHAFQDDLAAVRSGDPSRCESSVDAARCRQWMLQDPLGVANWIQSRTPGEYDGLVVGSERQGPPPANVRPLAAPPTWQDRSATGGTARFRPFSGDRRKGDRAFRRVSGPDLGIRRREPDATEAHEPFSMGRGVAAGDLDGDDRADLAFAERGGVRVFYDRGDRYEPGGHLAVGLDALSVRILEVDGVEGRDLVVSAYGGAVGWVPGASTDWRALPDGDRIASLAPAWADLDRDGDLDVILGNWSFGASAGWDPEHAADERFMGDGHGAFVGAPWDDLPGETLTVLITDLDGDGWPDVWAGNDGAQPDVMWKGSDQGLRRLGPGEAFAPPRTPRFNMSLDAADVDGDGAIEVFASDMGFGPPVVDDGCVAVAGDHAAECGRWVAEVGAARDLWPAGCDSDACRVAALLQLALARGDPERCERVPWATSRRLCEIRLARGEGRSHPPDVPTVPQVERNAFGRIRDGRYEVRDGDLGLPHTYWSWNARFVDLDLDGVPELPIGNGYLGEGPFPGNVHPDVLLRREGERWVDVAPTWGTDDLAHTNAWVPVDLGDDGDPDLVSHAVFGPVRVHVNETVAGHALRVSVDGGPGNRDGVGAKVVAWVGGRVVRTEVRASGGFLSAAPPEVWVGLGDATAADRLEVTMPTGERVVVEGPEAGRWVIGR